MILYDFSCPIDGLPMQVDAEEFPLSVKGANVQAGSAVGKHLHYEINQEITCGNGHVFTLAGELLLERSA